MDQDQLKLDIEAHKTINIKHHRPTIAPRNPSFKIMVIMRALCYTTTLARAISTYPSRLIGTLPASTQTQLNSSHRMAFRAMHIPCAQASPLSSQLSSSLWRSKIFCAGRTIDFNTYKLKVSSTILDLPSISRGRRVQPL